MKSKLVNRRNEKKATILRSKRTVEDAIQRAEAIKQAWVSENQNDPRIDELQKIVDHLSSVLGKSPQEMKTEGASSVEDYFDDAVMPEQAQTIKREVDMIAKWNREQRPQGTTPQNQGVSTVPDSAVVNASKKANGAAFVTDRDENGEPKAPEKVGVPRLAVKKKKEAVPEAAAPVVPVAEPAASAAPAVPAGGGSVNPIDYIPTEALIKIIGDMPKEEDFAQNKDKQDALIAMTEILKSRPVLPPEQPEGQAAPAASSAPALGPDVSAPAAPLPVAASKKADLGDHAMGGDRSVGGDSGSAATPPTGGNTNGGNPEPGQASTSVDLGAVNLASSEETPGGPRLRDFKI